MYDTMVRPNRGWFLCPILHLLRASVPASRPMSSAPPSTRSPLRPPVRLRAAVVSAVVAATACGGAPAGGATTPTPAPAPASHGNDGGGGAAVASATAIDRAVDLVQPATPGVAIVTICPGGAGNQVEVVQESGDAVTDQELLAQARAADPIVSCQAIAAIVRSSASIFGADPSPDDADAPGSPPPPPPPPPAPPHTVPPSALEALRVAGSKQLLPADSVKRAMAASGGVRLVVPVKICLDRQGSPQAVTLIKGSGFLAYDVDLLNGVSAWRYRPFTINGTPAPVCSVVMFSYHQVADPGGP